VFCRVRRRLGSRIGLRRRPSELYRQLLRYNCRRLLYPILWLTCGRENSTGAARQRHRRWMNELLVGYARLSTEQQDLMTQCNGLHAVGVG
jgi:hypothetical protein